MKRDMFVNRINEQEPPPVMNNDKLMRLVYTSFGISPETTFEEANKQFKEKLNNVSLFLSKAETIAEIDYNKTIESIRAYLTARGLALPKDFKAFWHWYVRHYGNSIDDYELNITQEQINEYSRELTAKLDYKPLFKYQTPLMQNPDKMYYLTPPHETERTKEIKQCILHIHNRVRAEEKGRALYHFDIHQFLSVQGITADLKAEILAEVRNTLRFFPEDKRADIEQIRAIINDYQPTQPQPTPHKTERLTLKQIALIYAYEGKNITDQNSNNIAKEYGFTSGHKLKQNYDYYRKPLNRKGLPGIVTNKTIQNKINLLNSVVPYLTDKNKSKVNDEVKILETSLIA